MTEPLYMHPEHWRVFEAAWLAEMPPREKSLRRLLERVNARWPHKPPPRIMPYTVLLAARWL